MHDAISTFFLIKSSQVPSFGCFLNYFSGKYICIFNYILKFSLGTSFLTSEALGLSSIISRDIEKISRDIKRYRTVFHKTVLNQRCFLFSSKSNRLAFLSENIHFHQNVFEILVIFYNHHHFQVRYFLRNFPLVN